REEAGDLAREVAVPGVERLAADTADGVRPLAEHLLLLRLPLAARLPPRIAQVVAQRDLTDAQPPVHRLEAVGERQLGAPRTREAGRLRTPDVHHPRITAPREAAA